MINLLPYKEKKTIEKIRFLRLAQSLITVLIFLILASFALLLPTWLTISSRENIINKQISSLENGDLISDSIDLMELENKARSLKNIFQENQKDSLIDQINSVKSYANNGISIDRFNANESSMVEIFGISKDRKSLQDFIDNLNSDPNISLVDNPISNFVKNKNGAFNLTIKFK